MKISGYGFLDREIPDIFPFIPDYILVEYASHQLKLRNMLGEEIDISQKSVFNDRDNNKLIIFEPVDIEENFWPLVKKESLEYIKISEIRSRAAFQIKEQIESLGLSNEAPEKILEKMETWGDVIGIDLRKMIK